VGLKDVNKNRVYVDVCQIKTTRCVQTRMGRTGRKGLPASSLTRSTQLPRSPRSMTLCPTPTRITCFEIFGWPMVAFPHTLWSSLCSWWQKSHKGSWGRLGCKWGIKFHSPCPSWDRWGAKGSFLDRRSRRACSCFLWQGTWCWCY